MTRTVSRPRLTLGRLVAVATVTCTLGCGMSLPSPSLVIDRRPLAVRVEVVTPLMPDDPDLAPRAQALPFEEVLITPFVVDPDGPVPPSELDGMWFACPLGPTQGAFDCISDALPIAFDDVPDCEPPPSMMSFDFDEIPDAQPLCLLSRDGAPRYTVPLDQNIISGGRVELTFVAGVPGGNDTRKCVDRLLSDDFELPDDCIYTTQVISVGPLERLFLLAEQFGIDLPPGFEAPPEDEIPDFDRHPRIDFFEASVVPESQSTERDNRESVLLGGSYAAELGQFIRFDTSSPEDDLQTFFIQSSDGSTREQMEFLEGRWFRDWGRLLADGSNDLSSYNELELRKSSMDDDRAPPGGETHVYYILRDGRAGVTWWWFTIDTPAP